MEVDIIICLIQDFEAENPEFRNNPESFHPSLDNHRKLEPTEVSADYVKKE